MSRSRYSSISRGALLLVGALTFVHACSDSGPSGPEVAVAVTPTAATVTAGLDTTFAATVTNHSNTAVTWSVQEGASGGSVDAAGKYTAPAAPGTYHVVATSVARPSVSATATVTVVAAPAITAFTAAEDTVAAGDSTTLTATFTGGTGAINQLVGAVVSGVAVSTGVLAATQVYTLTVTNEAGTTATAQTTVTVAGISAPSITSFTATPPTIASGETSTLLAVFVGDTAYVNPGAMPITTGVGVPVGPLTATANYQLVVKNASGDSVTAEVAVTVAGSPVITTFTATPPSIVAGDSTTLAWTASGATSFSIDQGVGAVTGSSVRVAPTETVVYTLTATNASGSVTATAEVTVVEGPSITSFTATPSVVTAGGASVLNAVFTGGTGVVDQSIGAATSGTPLPTGAIAATTTYTLTVSSGSGVVTRTVTVAVDPGFYVTTNPMTVARRLHTTVMLANGTVLALAGSPATATAETYDATPDAWAATTGTMTVARAQPAAVLLADGRVLVSGGFGSSDEPLSSAELYDPATRTFTATGSMTTARNGHSMHLLDDGRVLVVGGFGAGLLATAEIYNPATGTFTATGTMSSGRSFARLAPLAGGDVLVMGGGASASDGTSVEIYDVSAGTFGPTGGTTGGALSGAARLLDGSVLAVSASVAKRWAAGTATVAGPMLRMRSNAGISILPNGHVLVVADSGSVGLGISESEIYDPASNTFRLTGRPFESRSYATANLLTTGNVLVTGGLGASGALASSELYINGTGGSAPAPSAAITGTLTATTGSTGNVFEVPATSGARYIWHVTGGTITAGLGTNEITVTAGAVGTMQVRVLVVSELGIPSSGSAAITVTP